MPLKKLILLPAILILLILSCSSKSKLTDDAIQEDITIAVNNYNSDSWETRLNSIKSISKYSNTVYAKNSFLLAYKALDDSYSEVRIEALKILKIMKAAAAEEKIGTLALTDVNSNVKFFAFSALEEYGSIRNEDIFINGLDDKDWLVKEASLKGLLNIKDPGIQRKHLDIVIKSINNTNISIKLTAVSNLTVKDPLIYYELAKIVNDKESNLSILKAALQKIKGYRFDDKTKKRIIQLLTHRDKNVRILSLQALKQEGTNLDQ